jgi:hypothetical protein
VYVALWAPTATVRTPPARGVLTSNVSAAAVPLRNAWSVPLAPLSAIATAPAIVPKLTV